MIFHLHQPCFPLGHFIESFIYYRDYQAEHSLDRFLPDGNVHIVMDLGDAKQYIYDNNTLEEKQACHKAWFSGIRNHFLTIPSGTGREMFVINFHKGKSYPFSSSPLYELTDVVVDAELVSGNRILELREQLIAIPSAREKFRQAEQFLLRHYSTKFEINGCIDFAVQQIYSAPGIMTIEDIAGKVGYSRRHFIDLFKNRVGMTPKSFLKVCRFQKAIQEIEMGKTIDWSHIAHESGYYDQAHFINDFKDFSGFTPQQYLNSKNGQLNYVPLN